MTSLALNPTSPAVSAAAAAPAGTVQSAAALSVLKKSMNLQAQAAQQLLQALPQPPLASSGSLGTQVNTYA